MWSNFATEFAYNIIANLRMSWSGLSCHQGYLLLDYLQYHIVSPVWPSVVMTWPVFGCDTSLWKIILNQTTNTENNNLVCHTSMVHIYTGDKQLPRKREYLYDLYVVFMPPYSIFTQRFREYWNYGNGIKMCTGGTSYILQECSYRVFFFLWIQSGGCK